MDLFEAAGLGKDTVAVFKPWSRRGGQEFSPDEIVVECGVYRIRCRRGIATIYSRADGRPVTAGQVIARAGQVRSAQEEASKAYHEYEEACRAWSAKAMTWAISQVGPKPELRRVKYGRPPTKRCGRAMARDVGFDLAVLGVPVADSADLAAARAELYAAEEEWRKRLKAVLAEYESTNPAPSAPSIRDWHCYSASIVARELPE